MRFFISAFCIFAIILGSSCATTSKPQIMEKNCEENSERSPSSALLCDDLFQKKSTNKASEVINETTHQIVSKLKLASELLPASTSDAFWDTVIQLAENNDSKIKLDSSKMVLTKSFKNSVKIFSTYTYDTPSNSFIISKIEYSNAEHPKEVLSKNPIDPKTNKLRSDLLLNIESKRQNNKTLSITEHIPYSVYSKISSELSNLNLFTSHEIFELYKLPSAQRTIKYNTLSKTRSFKNYFMENIVQDYLLGPIKTVAISAASIVIFSQTDFVKNIISTTSTTPTWVAPAMVKMSGQYPKSVQPELVALMKVIAHQEKATLTPDEMQIIHKNAEQIRIDETDFLSIKFSKQKNEAYFLISHEKEDGQVDIYATTINRSQYPELIQYFNTQLE